MQAFADPISMLQVLMDCGKVSASSRRKRTTFSLCSLRPDCANFLGLWQFDEAFQEFEAQLEDFKPKIGEELYNSMLLQVMIQVTLQGLRHKKSGKKDIDDFKERCVSCACDAHDRRLPLADKVPCCFRVKTVFAEASRNRAHITSLDPATVAKVRLELLTATTKDVDDLLSKYSIASFKDGAARFWGALRRAQPPTKLEKVMMQIEDGVIQWNDEDEIEDEAPAPRAAAGSAVPAGSPAKSPVKASRRAVVDAVQEPAQAPRGRQKRGFMMTAWELKEALLGAASESVDEDDNQDWTDIHQQTHPEIKAYLQGRRSSGKEEQGSAKAGGAREEVEEEGMAASSMPKRRRVDAPVRGAGASTGAGGKGVKGGAGGVKAVADLAGDTEEDEDEDDASGGGRASSEGASGKNGATSIDAKDKVSLSAYVYACLHVCSCECVV